MGAWLKLSDRWLNLNRLTCVHHRTNAGGPCLGLHGADGLEFATVVDKGDIAQLLAVLNQNSLLPHAPSPALMPVPASHVPVRDDGYVCGWCMGTRKVLSRGSASGDVWVDCLHCTGQPKPAPPDDEPAPSPADDMLTALTGLLDGLDANGDPERGGLSQGQWEGRIKKARQAEAAYAKHADNPVPVPEQVAALSGRELDAAVATHVMGWTNVDGDSVSTWGKPPDPGNQAYNGCGRRGYFHVPRWGSGDANAAMAVLCKARGEPPCWFNISPTHDGGYQCHLHADGDAPAYGSGAIISEAICRAALHKALAGRATQE